MEDHGPDSSDGVSFQSASVHTISEIRSEDSMSALGNIEDASEGSISMGAISHQSSGGSLYRVVDGRAFNTRSETYVLPADDDEHSRLDMQHLILCLMHNSLYPFKALVTHRLNTSINPQILDVGTGSGKWAADMAMTFPRSSVVGLDLVPPLLLGSGDVPKNCRFEIDDMNLSLEHYAHTFTLVHARSIVSGLNDPESFFYSMARILVPHGIMIMACGDLQFYDERHEPITWVEPGQPGFTRIQYIAGLVYKGYLQRGNSSGNSMLFWKEWLDENPNYYDTQEEHIFVPIGPWKEGLNDRETLAANFMREDLARLFVAYRRHLAAEGHPEENINLWIQEAEDELGGMKRRMYCRWRFACAIRSDSPWQDREPRAVPLDLTTRGLIKGIEWPPS